MYLQLFVVEDPSLFPPVYKECDAAEYLEKILGMVNPEVSKVGIQHYLPHLGQNLIANHAMFTSYDMTRLTKVCLQIFKGQLRHITTCLGKHVMSDGFGPFWTLPLSIADPSGSYKTYSVVGKIYLNRKQKNIVL